MVVLVAYAFEAASRVLGYAMDELKLERVVSRVAAGNEASEALMRKLGMQRMPAYDYVHPADRTPLIVYGLARCR